MLDCLTGQVEEWREEADLLRRRGAPRQADALESAADDLEERLEEWRLEALSLEQAARESGLAYDTVQRKVGEELPNAGEKGRPRVRRCDLHAWLDAPEPEAVESDVVGELARETLGGRS